ncbi:hypothetical protein DV735_g3599, partial [Chaetothyriales sp. CBS 134920]
MASPRSNRVSPSTRKTLRSSIKATLKSLRSVLVTGRIHDQRTDLTSSQTVVVSLDSNLSTEALSSHIQLVLQWQCMVAKASTLSLPNPDPFVALPSSRRCVFDINIRIPGLGGKVAKRVLLDTGADLNLIAASAHEDVGSSIDLEPARLLSLGGRTLLKGKTELTFNFLATAGSSAPKNTYTEVFAVVARTEPPLFDCILGAHWILSHFEDFIMLMASRIILSHLPES